MKMYEHDVFVTLTLSLRITTLNTQVVADAHVQDMLREALDRQNLNLESIKEIDVYSTEEVE